MTASRTRLGEGRLIPQRGLSTIVTVMLALGARSKLSELLTSVCEHVGQTPPDGSLPPLSRSQKTSTQAIQEQRSTPPAISHDRKSTHTGCASKGLSRLAHAASSDLPVMASVPARQTCVTERGLWRTLS